jgi:flagellar assembly factor FliW
MGYTEPGRKQEKKKDYLDGTVNLKCPLAINPDTRKGIQVILSNADYDYRHTLRSLLGKEIKEQDTKKGDK